MPHLTDADRPICIPPKGVAMTFRCSALYLISALIGIQLFAQPAIKVDRLFHDFGKLHTLDPVKTTFVITNTGNEPLHVQRIDTSCDCTTAAIPQPFLKGGEHLTIEVVFDPKSQKGFVHKSAYIISNDPKKSTLELSLEADIIPEILCTPDVLYFTQALRTRSLTRRITVKASNGLPFKILSTIVENSPALTVQSKATELENHLEITFDGSRLPEKERHGQGFIILKTDHPKHPELKIPFYWSSAPTLQVEPEQLDFIPNAASTPKNKTYDIQDVFLRQLQNEKFKILKVIESPDFVEIEGLKNAAKASKSEHRLRVRIIPKKLQDSQTGLIVLSTDNKAQELVQIRIFALKD